MPADTTAAATPVAVPSAGGPVPVAALLARLGPATPQDQAEEAGLALATDLAVSGAGEATLRRLEAALAACRAEGDRAREAALAAALALAHLGRRDRDAAATYVARARALSRASGRVLPVVDLAEAEVALAAGDPGAATTAFRGLAAATEAAMAAAPDAALGRPLLRFVVLAGLAEARFAAGDAIGARAFAREALRLDAEDPRRRVRLHELLGRPEPTVVLSPELDLEHRVVSLSRQLDARTRELEQARIDLRDLDERTRRDALTGLVDRRHLLEVLGAVAAAGRPHAVLVIDLDRFGRINAAMGHRRGDELLARLAGRIAAAVGPEDVVARSGEDEFVVLLTDVADLGAARGMAGAVAGAVRRPLSLGGEELHPSVSVGLAMTAGHDTGDAVLRQACLALERAKSAGRDRLEVFGADLEVEARRRSVVEALVRGALERDWFELHFQPVHPNDGSSPLAAEALLRLRDPGSGRLIPPAEFLPVVEEAGLAVPVGAWVLEAASATAAGWTDLGVPFRLAVNVSARQLVEGFASSVLATLADRDLDPSHLVVELTEDVLLDAADAEAAELRTLRSAGVSVALDDFGTAYSSLSHLRQLPVDVVKVDRSFVAGMCRTVEDHAIVAAVVELSRTFGFAVIAEGVETIEQLDLQRRLGCHGAQGFLIGRPKPAGAFAELLTSRPLLWSLAGPDR